ncbi:XRE family transcriptional regulator [Rhizobium leguminosarum]|uniref:helix-turn-helix domain-containing protein n=1 Tax=Rhizobium leguminosarum TaxID=384 RepID=UPI001032071A|nr:helix-turn-helix transcriptional regulator [Rhizobium leguminosarum]TBG08436.1 XRE family transcriptional regulator [Rhizobium leguminosarum]
MAEMMDDRQQLGLRIDKARRAMGLSFVLLAQRTGYDERTIRNVVKGLPTRVSTVAEICQALGLDPSHAEEHRSIKIADEDHGGYTFSQYDEYIGLYHATRRSFTYRNRLVRSIFDFSWSIEKNCLIFQETQILRSERSDLVLDYSQTGEIYISNTTGMIHLQTLKEGSVRLVTLTKMRMDDRTLHGMVLTQSPQSFYYKPSVSPIYLQKDRGEIDHHNLSATVRSIADDDPAFEEANEHLLEIERNIGVLSIGNTPPDRRRS